jgi:hypothetical protein
VLRLLLLVALTACGDNIDAAGHSHSIEDQLAEWLTSQGAVHGTVYACASGADCGGESEEWCFWPDSADELRDLLGAPCHEITLSERRWPALVGCAYACPLEGPGANAHCGNFCPPEGQP